MEDRGWRGDRRGLFRHPPSSILHPRLLLLFAVLCALCGFPPSAAANKVTVRDDRTLLVDGRPFFPVGLYYPEDEIADPTGNLLKDLRATGFNTIFFHTGGKPLDEAKAQLDRIAAAGLHVQFRPPGDLLSVSDDLKKAVEAFKSHPAMLFWEHVDEPLVNGVKFEQSAPGYRLIKQLDPDHPVLLVQWPDWKREPELKQWGALCDVYAFDKYPVPLKRWWYQGADIPNGWPHSIAVMGEITAWWQSLVPQKPAIAILQAWSRKPAVDGKEGYPTAAQSRFMAYQVVIRGAKGILYYGKMRVSAPHTPSSIPEEINPDPKALEKDFQQAKELNDWFWASFKPVVKEVSDMAPVFAAPDAPWKPEVKIAGDAPPPAKSPIEFRAKQLGEQAVLLLVNSSERPVRATISAPPFATAGAAHGWNGTVSPKGVEAAGTFTEEIEPFGVRVYADRPQP